MDEDRDSKTEFSKIQSLKCPAGCGRVCTSKEEIDWILDFGCCLSCEDMKELPPGGIDREDE
jgi:hypothetical protein